MGSTAQTTRTLTPELRQQLRIAIDHRRRELENDDQPRCAGCGCHHDERSAGCRTCTNRWLRRKWRVDDTYRARERLYDRFRRPPGSRVQSRPAGTLETVTSLSSPAGRRPPHLRKSGSAGNRQSREATRG